MLVKLASTIFTSFFDVHGMREKWGWIEKNSSVSCSAVKARYGAVLFVSEWSPTSTGDEIQLLK
ncbi:hypothetical protein KQ940_10845 [Marinobacterium sp. D7]|nr:hypothetical protein [Marinobacterium ramblicola]